VVFCASVLALGGVAFAHGQVVQAAESTYPVSCTTLGNLDVAISASSDPAVATAGGSINFNTSASLPPQTLAIAVTRATLTFPVPAQVQVSDVMFMGGNLQGVVTTNTATTLVLTFTGNQPLSNLQIPSLMIMGRVRAGTEGQTIRWGGPTAITVTTSLLSVSCTGDGRTLTTTPIAGAPTTTSTRATTTSTIATTTSTRRATTTSTRRATTTSTRATTTSTRATTTTTEGTTTTTVEEGTTTTTEGTTTTTVEEGTTTTTMRPPPVTWPPNPFREYFRQLFCRLWRLPCPPPHVAA
jgi:hypothetical protein